MAWWSVLFLIKSSGPMASFGDPLWCYFLTVLLILWGNFTLTNPKCLLQLNSQCHVCVWGGLIEAFT